MPPEVIPSINNQNTGSVQTNPNTNVYTTSNPSQPNSQPSSSGVNVASLITPTNLTTLKSLKENPKSFGDQLTDQGKQKVIVAATNSTYVKLKTEQIKLIEEGIQLDISHRLTLARLELKHTPKKQYVNGVVQDIPPDLDDEEYQKAVEAENINYNEAKRILQEKKDKNQKALDDYKKDPFKNIKDKIKKRKENRKNKKNRTQVEKRKSRKEKTQAVLKNARKTLGPVLTLIITNKIAEIVAQNDKIQKLVNDTNDIIIEANESGDPLKLSNAKLARDNAIKIINNNETKITKVAEIINRISVYINIFSLVVSIISSIPIPTSVPPGIGIPVNLIMKFVKILDKANRILLMLSSLIPLALSVLQKAIAILEDLKSQLLNVGSAIEIASVSGVIGTSDLIVSSEEGGLTTGIFPVEYKGWKFAIREENNPNFVVRGYKRHYAVAIDENNVEVLKSESSFTLDPNDLIEQLKIIIDRENLIPGISSYYTNDPSKIGTRVSGEDKIFLDSNSLSPSSVGTLVNEVRLSQSNTARKQNEELNNRIDQRLSERRPPLTNQQKEYYTRVSIDITKPFYERQNAKEILKRNYI